MKIALIVIGTILGTLGFVSIVVFVAGMMENN